jgi:hypothetical protein
MPEQLTVEAAVSKFGARAKQKLANPGAMGQPEDQLRAPLEQLLADIAALCKFPANAVVAVGESSQNAINPRRGMLRDVCGETPQHVRVIRPRHSQ